MLDKNATLPKFCKDNLNSLIEKGMNFTVATARTNVTSKKILEGLNLKYPAIVMNGVASYDFSQSKYATVEYINKSGVDYLISTIEKLNMSGFIFYIEKDNLNVIFENTNTPNAEKFIEERRKNYNKAFHIVDSFNDYRNKEIIYYSISDKREKLIDFYNELKKCESLNIEFYRDVYAEDFWYMEVSSAKASKYNAVVAIKKQYGFDRVVGFGDNFNDIPLFNACDECYAVQNAKEEVKQKATGTIESNENFGVVKKLIEII